MKLNEIEKLKVNPEWAKLPLFNRKGWKRYRFDQIAENIRESVMPTPADSKLYIGLEHMDSGSLRIGRWGSESDLIGQKLRMRKGDILFARRNAYLRRVATAPHDGLFSAHGMILRARHKVVLREFLPFLMMGKYFMDRAEKISVGSLSPTINWTTLKLEEFDIPPLDQQRQLTDLLVGCENLTQCVNQITVELEDLKKAQIRERVWGSGFPTVTFGEYAEIVDPNPSHRYPDSSEAGIPLVSTANFNGEDGFDYTACQRVPGEVYKAQYARCRFEATDVVFARKGVIGLARKYGEGEKCFSHTIAILKPKRSVIAPGFLLNIARSDNFLAAIARQMNSNSGVPTLGLQTLAGIRVPLLSLEEQSKVDRSIELIEASIRATNDRSRSTSAFRTSLLNVLS